MRPQYTIQATARFKSDRNAEGTTECREVFCGWNGEQVIETSRALPELGPKRVFDRNQHGPIVLPILNRRFKVSFKRAANEDDDDDFGGIPEPGFVTFEETTEPETPFTLWDAKAHLEARIARMEGDIQGMTKDGYGVETSDLVRRLTEARAELAAESWGRYSPNNVTSAFGQPVFVQNKCFPTHEGRAASHLLTSESGWGDSGNENYMVALDGDGYPVAVFHEASCC